MARCERSTETVYVIPTQIKTYLLTLTEEEAEVIKVLVGNTGGCNRGPDPYKDSIRGFTDRIYYALSQAGVKDAWAVTTNIDQKNFYKVVK